MERSLVSSYGDWSHAGVNLSTGSGVSNIRCTQSSRDLGVAETPGDFITASQHKQTQRCSAGTNPTQYAQPGRAIVDKSHAKDAPQTYN